VDAAEALIRKPDALPGATALEQPRAAGKFTRAYDAWRSRRQVSDSRTTAGRVSSIAVSKTAEAGHPLCRSVVRDPEELVLVPVPAGIETHLEATVEEQVDGRRLLAGRSRTAG
jgi:hypothetical protein